MKSVISSVFCMIVLLLHSVGLSSWSPEAYQAIGMAGMSAINTPVMSRFKKLMGGKDLVDVIGWSRNVIKNHPGFEPIKRLLQDKSDNCDAFVIDDGNCPENRCIVKALEHFFSTVMNLDSTPPLSYADGLQLTDIDAIMFIIDLIGDLHQPFNLGFKTDDGGRDLTVQFVNEFGEKVNTSMEKYWGTDLIQKIVKESPGFWYGGWTHVQFLEHERDRLRAEWDQVPDDSKISVFGIWGKQSFSLLCSKVYLLSEGQPTLTNGTEISHLTEYVDLEMIKRQILVAGLRLSFVIDFILSNRELNRLRLGSGVEKHNLETKIYGASAPHPYLKGFCINFLIISSVLIVLAYIVKYYSSNLQTNSVKNNSYVQVAKLS